MTLTESLFRTIWRYEKKYFQTGESVQLVRLTKQRKKATPKIFSMKARDGALEKLKKIIASEGVSQSSVSDVARQYSDQNFRRVFNTQKN